MCACMCGYVCVCVCVCVYHRYKMSLQWVTQTTAYYTRLVASGVGKCACLSTDRQMVDGNILYLGLSCSRV